MIVHSFTGQDRQDPLFVHLFLIAFLLTLYVTRIQDLDRQQLIMPLLLTLIALITEQIKQHQSKREFYAPI